MVYLSGRLEVVVIDARGLPNVDNSIFNSNDKSDPYCVVNIEGVNGSRRLGKTFTIDDSLNPKWHYVIKDDINQDVTGVKFIVKDKDTVGSEVIGSCFLPCQTFTLSGHKYRGLLHLTSTKGRPAGSLRVQVIFSGSGGNVVGDTSINERVKLMAGNVKTRLGQTKGHKFASSQFVFLHGMLDIYIDKAINLPNLDASILKKKNVSDPFVEVVVEDKMKETWKVATTTVHENQLNPVWGQRFMVNICHDVVSISFVIKDEDLISNEKMGTVTLKSEDLKNSKEIKGEFEIYSRGKAKKKSRLFLSIQYMSCEEIINSIEVPACTYPLRDLSHVTLYQDAHCVHLPLQVPDKHGHLYSPTRAWNDLYNAIISAEQFIYVVGWSVNTNVTLQRSDGEDQRNLGEIFLQKAEQGVRIIIMQWDEVTSTNLNKEGAMGTSDQATAEFFKDTPVSVILTARQRNPTNDVIGGKETFTSVCYSHHQKCVIVDSPVIERPGKKKLVAFVGGLDMTNGRFDTPEHHLFQTLETDHKDDFYSKIFVTKQKYGPRQPWHDIHCRLEGPIVFDLLTNFQERIRKQGSKLENEIFQDEEPLKYTLCTPDKWAVQMFRSINSDSAIFNPSTSALGLSVKQDRTFDNSIQKAYIHHIRRSKKFLYMENQYFLGSSHGWLSCRDTNITNLIPMEIVAHIENQIKKGERYTAYIVVPMFPEGVPTDKVVQEILHWQYRTMEMMYTRIAEAINDAGINAHPQDYLLFFCLGKKEEGINENLPDSLQGHARLAYQHKRLMIYVHSKMVIFDDEYIIVGSANINDRSMNGNRDTEIAIGAYQPHYMVEGPGSLLPRGDVSTFRKALWSEHMGSEAPINLDPSDLTCAKVVKELAAEGLLSYMSNGPSPGARHLLLYPLLINIDGSIQCRDDCKTFPDTTASIIGSRSGFIPTKLTS